MIKNNLASEKIWVLLRKNLLYAHIGLYKSQLTHKCTISATVLIDFVITVDNMIKRHLKRLKKIHTKDIHTKE